VVEAFGFLAIVLAVTMLLGLWFGVGVAGILAVVYANAVGS
jgi:hypothetical protein